MPSNIIPGWSIHTADDYKCVCVGGREKEKSFESSIKDERKTSFIFFSNFEKCDLDLDSFSFLVEPIDHP